MRSHCRVNTPPTLRRFYVLPFHRSKLQLLHGGVMKLTMWQGKYTGVDSKRCSAFCCCCFFSLFSPPPSPRPASLSRLDNLALISAQDRSVFVDLLTITDRSRPCGLNVSDRLSREVFRQNANKQVTVGLRLMSDNDLVYPELLYVQFSEPRSCDQSSAQKLSVRGTGARPALLPSEKHVNAQREQDYFPGSFY